MRVAHYSRLSKIVIDVPGTVHEAEVAFWQGALGRTMRRFEAYPDFHGAELDATGYGMLIQRLGEGEARLHLDIHTTDRTAEVERLTALGATVLHTGPDWSVLRDPAGLVFCVVPDPTLTEADAQRWD